MNPQELLTQLAPLRSPPAVSWWPLAPGWWALIIVCSLLLFGLCWMVWQRYAKNRYRREALARLQALRDEGADTAALNRLLKVLALRVYGSESAALSGVAWTRFLALHCAKVDDKELAPLADIYGPVTPSISPTLADTVTRWIRFHEGPDV